MMLKKFALIFLHQKQNNTPVKSNGNPLVLLSFVFIYLPVTTTISKAISFKMKTTENHQFNSIKMHAFNIYESRKGASHDSKQIHNISKSLCQHLIRKTVQDHSTIQIVLIY